MISFLFSITMGDKYGSQSWVGNFLVSQVAGCRCSLLAGNTCISLAGSEEQINVSQQSPKMLKMASEGSVSSFVVVFTSFSQNLPLGAPAFPLDSDLSGG